MSTKTTLVVQQDDPRVSQMQSSIDAVAAMGTRERHVNEIEAAAIAITLGIRIMTNHAVSLTSIMDYVATQIAIEKAKYDASPDCGCPECHAERARKGTH